MGCASLEAFRIAEGIPAYGIDIVERDLPQETSQMRALHFSKGCYLGQEIVERIRSRGSVHRHLRPLELTARCRRPATELTQEDGKAAGHITSAAELPLASGSRVFALGMIRAEAEAAQPALHLYGRNGHGHGPHPGRAAKPLITSLAAVWSRRVSKSAESIGHWRS